MIGMFDESSISTYINSLKASKSLWKINIVRQLSVLLPDCKCSSRLNMLIQLKSSRLNVQAQE